MKIYELIDNGEFLFNVKFRIYRYESPEICSEEEGESYLEYDSESDMDFNMKLYKQDISAINQAEDGTIEIEYCGSAW